MSQSDQDSRKLQRVRVTENSSNIRFPVATTPRTVLKSILKPSSSNVSIKPTHHGISRKAIANRGPIIRALPSQPDQPSTSNDPAGLRARKSSAGKSGVPSTSTSTNRRPIKSYKSLPPLDQQLDNEYEERLLSQKRDRSGNMAGFARRMTQIRREANVGEAVLRLNADDPQHVTTQLSPILKLRISGQDSGQDSDEDEPRYRPQPRVTNVKVQNVVGQRALKAARKYQSVEPASDSDSSGSSSSSSDSSSSSGSERTVRRGHSPKSKSTSDSEDIIMVDVDPNPPELVFDEAMMITAPLPDIDNVEHVEEILPAHLQPTPSANLVSAVRAQSAANLRKTRRLPFLPRSVRKGFLERCRKLLVPIYPLDKEIQLQVRYTIAGGEVYQVDMKEWMCPICDFYKQLPTKEMLECHLQWDHQDVYCEWEDLGSREIQSWRLELLIQEAQPEFVSPTPLLRSSVQETIPETMRSPSTDTPQIKRSLTPDSHNDSGIFPYVSLSPSTSGSVSRQSVLPDIDIKREEIEGSLELPESSASPSRGPTPTISEMSFSSTLSSGSVSRSLPLPRRYDPAPISSVPRSRLSTTLLSSASQTPPPPPPGNRLGPAAQPPYLPSDIGGNLVLYSCRPGGPCLFDLLATLPMEPFGLIDWEVIDREDEIYESDDVKEEYKVMHALWARWVILNRNKFIANYAKGMIVFVDEYWKMIHWAAGWDALRYFLFIFLANRFLTGHEVAQTLTHYEGLTGMASWDDESD